MCKLERRQLAEQAKLLTRSGKNGPQSCVSRSMLEETTKQLAEVSSERDALQIEVNDLTSAIEQLEILQKEGEDSLEATKAVLKSIEDNLASMQVL